MSRLERRVGESWVADPIPYRNRLGREVYQPALITGERMWVEPAWDYYSHVWANREGLEKAAREHAQGKASGKTPPRPVGNLAPVLTSYRRAVRLARAESRAKYRRMYIDDYKEVR